MSYNSKYTGAQVEELLDQIENKQNEIEDLEAIREGAAKGATALQSIPSEYVTENELNAKGYATTSQVNAKQDTISDLATIRSGAALGSTAIQSVKTINGESILGEGNIVVNVDTSNLATKEELNAKQDVIEDLETIRSGAAKGATALQEHQDISHLASKEELLNLQNEVVANEEVTATALNNLNDRKADKAFVTDAIASAITTTLNTAV